MKAEQLAQLVMAQAHETALGCWLIDVDAGTLVSESTAQGRRGPAPDSVRAFATLLRQAELLAKGRASATPLHVPELALTASRNSYFATLLSKTALGVVLVTDSQVTAGIGWAALRQASEALTPFAQLLPGLTKRVA